MRLIDADALEEELKKDIMGGLNYRWYINNAPTVVVLEQIRAEIEDIEEGISSYDHDRPWVFKDEVLQIIDKYKGDNE